MSNILQFPSQQAQALTYLDRELRQMLTARGADPDLIDFAANQLTSIYAEHGEEEREPVTLKLPGDLNPDQVSVITDEVAQALEGVRADNHRVILKLIAELVLAQLRIYSHERKE